MPKVVTVAKAAPVCTLSGEVESATLEICEQVPEFRLRDGLDAVGNWYAFEARKIERLLHNTLPGGTYDRLLGMMMARKACYFRVTHARLDYATPPLRGHEGVDALVKRIENGTTTTDDAAAVEALVDDLRALQAEQQTEAVNA